MHENFIIMSFPRFAGGKFISNCLSLSQYACPQDPVTAKYLLEHPDDYNYRLSAVMQTLPPSRPEMIKWIEKYEFGDFQLYHKAFEQWTHGIFCEPTDLTKRLLDKNFRLFLTAHGGDPLIRNLVKVWPNSVIVKLINHTKFSEISRKHKSNDHRSIDEYAGNYCRQKYESLAGDSWPSWEEFESVGYDIRKLPKFNSVAEEILSFYNWSNLDNYSVLFDIDGSIFSRTKFLIAMENLYEQLGFTDYNSELVSQFWQSYMALHIDNVDLT
jgi:hypothetical protein